MIVLVSDKIGFRRENDDHINMFSTNTYLFLNFNYILQLI